MIFRDLAKIFQEKKFNIFAIFKALKVAEQRLAGDKPHVCELLHNTSWSSDSLAEELKDNVYYFKAYFHF